MWTQLWKSEANAVKNLGGSSRVCVGVKRSTMANPSGWGRRRSDPTVINSAGNSGIDSGSPKRHHFSLERKSSKVTKLWLSKETGKMEREFGQGSGVTGHREWLQSTRGQPGLATLDTPQRPSDITCCLWSGLEKTSKSIKSNLSPDATKNKPSKCHIHSFFNTSRIWDSTSALGSPFQ
ncbi:hypothetical protein HGM15179_017041 [Zosterops borbonicus]|uniref:Uncharacterized protein n=1 Tax=Zosterops borbonicus TaxID=364589 RepID=A0A8K1G1I9_9PASS|nr:hypothetical protein HGM15179_017041 [Zosterops borbonicus]